MPDLSTDQITFTDYKIPSLPAGRYSFSAEMNIVSGNKIQESHLWQTSIEFEVKATRFKLEPDEVYSVSPPNNSVDNYAGIVPSIFFRNSSLPWLRKPDSTSGSIPWLVLVCVAQSELTDVITTSTTIQQYCDAHHLTLEEGDSGSDSLLLLNIPDFYHFLLPKHHNGELNYTAAVKNSTLTGEVASLMGFRLPAAGKNVVYLVSIENRFPLPDSGTWQFPILYSWAFECRDPASDTANVLASMAHGDLAFCLPQVPNDLQHPESNPNNWLKNGYVLLPHQFRNGQSSVSWYKGPFSPAKINVQPSLPAVAADSLSMFDPATGMLDVSYATAWQLGRQLALQSIDFSGTLYKWKRQTMLLDKFRQQVSDRDASLPVLAKVNRWNVLNDAQAIFFKLGRTNEQGTWQDYSGNNQVINPQGDPDVQFNDIFGSSVYLNLTTGWQFMNIPTNYAVGAIGPTFYSLWFQPIALDANIEYGLLGVWSTQIIQDSHGTKQQNTLLYSVNVKSDQIIFFNHLVSLFFPVDLTEPVWHHIMLSETIVDNHNGTKTTTIRLYWQGSEVKSTYYTTPNVGGTITLRIGDVGNGHKFKGGIAHFRAYRTSVNNGDMALIEQADLIAQKLHPWFNKWAVLKDIPFNYLVPDERMLPVESIRFFKVDTHWLSCLIDGAFSVGRCSNATLAEDAQLLEDLHLQPFHSLSGVLIRSASVGQIKGLNVDGFSELINGQTDLDSIKLRCIRKESLSNDTLLILFEGEAKTLQIYPAPENVHYGFTFVMSPINPGVVDSLQKEIRNMDGSPHTTHIFNFNNASTRMLPLYTLASGLIPPSQTSSSPAIFAMEMLEGTWKIQINAAS